MTEGVACATMVFGVLMANGPKRTTTQDIEAVGGPVQLIEQHQTRLATKLAGILERRHAVKRHLGANDDEAEREIQKICAAFLADIRNDTRQLVLDAYSWNRYVKAEHRIAADAPESSWDVWEVSPELGARLKPTLPYGQIPTPIEPKKTPPHADTAIVQPEGGFEDFSDLFGERKKP